MRKSRREGWRTRLPFPWDGMSGLASCHLNHCACTLRGIWPVSLCPAPRGLASDFSSSVGSQRASRVDLQAGLGNYPLELRKRSELTVDSSPSSLLQPCSPHPPPRMHGLWWVWLTLDLLQVGLGDGFPTNRSCLLSLPKAFASLRKTASGWREGEGGGPPALPLPRFVPPENQ